MFPAFALTVAVASMILTSGDVGSGGTIARSAMATDCGGANRPPTLHWSGAPAGTKSFALTLYDPDAPLPGGFYHWIVYDVPASATGLARGALPSGAALGVISLGKAAYYGPCPPPGPPHHYVVTLYALDVTHLGGAPTGAQLQERIAGHILARATIAATAGRS